MRTTKQRWPALIVGGGPVGLYASALLSAYRVPSLLTERAPSAKAKRHPRSHYINSRSMELLRELGVEAAVREQTPPLDEWRHFRYCSSLLGRQIAAQDHAGGAAWADLCSAGATEVAHLSQPKLEAILRTEAEKRAPAAGGELLGGYECVSFKQKDDGVLAELRKFSDGVEGDEVMQVEAAQLLACDGANSPIRRALGLRLRGPPPLQHFKSVHFRAPDLAPMLRVLRREAMLHFCFCRGAIAVLVAHNIGQGEWVAQLPYFPGLQDADALDEAACTDAIAACIGGSGAGGAESAVPFEVQSIGSWAMSAVVAERLTLGNIHLLGDAAHQFPPAGAFGANTGLQDAHNICWKIGAVHDGAATAGLIRSYDAERRPVALANARLSVHNYHRGLRVANALGLPTDLPHAIAKVASDVRSAITPPPPGEAWPFAAAAAAAAASANAAANAAAAAAGKAPPSLAGVGGIAARLLEIGRDQARSSAVGSRMLEVGRGHLIEDFGHEANHPLGRWRLSSARRVVESGAALPLLFARHELGFIYPDMRGAADGNDADQASDTTKSIEDEVYVPSTVVGARLPHHWLHTSSPQADGGQLRLSTHDLIHDWNHAWNHDLADWDREPAKSADASATSERPLLPSLPPARPPRMTLLVDAAAGGAWAVGAAKVDVGSELLRVVAVSTASDSVESSGEAVDKVVQLATDPCGGWASKRQVEPTGALLVRPDGHLAWRCERLPPEADAESLVREALESTFYEPRSRTA